MNSNWKARFRSAWWIGSFIALIGLMSQAVRGQSPAPNDTEDTRERLVMLSSGRILSGQVSRNAGGYLVEQPNGRVQVSSEEVLFVVNDLREAYRKQRDSVKYPTPASHVALANWCISHRLHDEARDELKKSLKSDPENEEARRLLQRLTDTMRASLPPAPTKRVPLKTFDGFLQPDVESLGGLSRETAMQFTSKIQPLLLNKCGNAGCHGVASSNGFRLVAARIGGNGSRQNTERNLAEAMKQIDFQDVAGSHLLSIAMTGHGGKGTIFVGPAGHEQYKLLKTWAKRVAEEQQANAAQLAQRPSINGRNQAKNAKRHFATEEVKPAGFTSSEIDDESRPVTSSTFPPRELPKDTIDPEVDLRQDESSLRSGGSQPPRNAKADLKPFDPFDPEIFNRQLP
jgi:hypothetical protein